MRAFLLNNDFLKMIVSGCRKIHSGIKLCKDFPDVFEKIPSKFERDLCFKSHIKQVFKDSHKGLFIQLSGHLFCLFPCPSVSFEEAFEGIVVKSGIQFNYPVNYFRDIRKPNLLI